MTQNKRNKKLKFFNLSFLYSDRFWIEVLTLIFIVTITIFGFFILRESFQVLAATSTVRPNGDYETMDWTDCGQTYHYECIDEAVSEPDSGGSDYISAGSVRFSDEFEMGTVDMGGGSASSVEVWVLGYGSKPAETDVTLYWSGGNTSAQIVTLPTSEGWVSTTFTGLSLSQDDLNSLRIRLTTTQGGRSYLVNVLYADVTYTSPPTVTTSSASDIGTTSATGNGEITDTGGEDCDERGFVWDTTSRGDPGNTSPDNSNYPNSTNETGTFGTGTFSLTMSGLSSGTTYYYRAYAHNSTGYSYGGEVSFTTVSIAISITDGTVGYGTLGLNSTADTVSMTGYVDPDGDGATIEWNCTDGSGSDGDCSTGHYTTIDEGTRDPNTPNTDGYISVANNGSSDYLTMGTLTNPDSVSQIDVYVYGKIEDTAEDVNVDISKDGSNWEGAQSLSLGTTNAWKSSSFTGLSWSKTDLDGLQVKLTKTGGGSYTAYIYSMYAKISYNQSQTVSNDGDAAEDFNIKGQNSDSWTLAGTAGNEQYKHEFSSDSGSTWTALTTSYQDLALSIASGATVGLDLRITTPTSTSVSSQQNVDVTVQAVESGS